MLHAARSARPAWPSAIGRFSRFPNAMSLPGGVQAFAQRPLATRSIRNVRIPDAMTAWTVVIMACPPSLVHEAIADVTPIQLCREIGLKSSREIAHQCQSGEQAPDRQRHRRGNIERRHPEL